MAKKPYSYTPATVEEPPAPASEALPPEPPPIAITATSREDEALTERLTNYVHHRLNQHLPSAIAFYVAELREVIAGKRA